MPVVQQNARKQGSITKEEQFKRDLIEYELYKKRVQLLGMQDVYEVNMRLMQIRLIRAYPYNGLFVIQPFVSSVDTPFRYYEGQFLKVVNLHNRITNMSCMFSGCRATQLDLTQFDTTNVRDMANMFSGCRATQLDLTQFDTTNVRDMSKMFSSCSLLKTLDLSTFDTTNVQVMCGMFSSCESLQSINLSSFNTQIVYDMRDMFFNCKCLRQIDLTAFNTYYVTSMSGMFSGCSSLCSLNLSSFNTKNVDDMRAMFSGCVSLQTLNIANFVFDVNTSVTYMLDECNQLRQIILKDKARKEFLTRKHTRLGHSLLYVDILYDRKGVAPELHWQEHH